MNDKSTECQFSILEQFDNWFSWNRDVIFHGLTPEQAQKNIDMAAAGWKLADGHVFGCWTLPRHITPEWVLFENCVPILPPAWIPWEK